MNINLKTSFSTDGLIFQEMSNDIEGTMHRTLINAREAGVRDALVKLGWAPPKTDAELLDMRRSFEQHFASKRGLNLDECPVNEYASKNTQAFWECWQEACKAK